MLARCHFVFSKCSWFVQGFLSRPWKLFLIRQGNDAAGLVSITYIIARRSENGEGNADTPSIQQVCDIVYAGCVITFIYA